MNKNPITPKCIFNLDKDDIKLIVIFVLTIVLILIIAGSIDQVAFMNRDRF